MKKEILIVEDNRSQSKILEMFFNHRGFDTFVCENAEDGLKMLKDNHNFCLMTLDINLPGMSGLHLLSLIRKDSKFDDTPIVMISALSQDINIVKAMELGANHYLTKPVSMNKLEGIIEKYLKCI